MSNNDNATAHSPYDYAMFCQLYTIEIFRDTVISSIVAAPQCTQKPYHQRGKKYCSVH